MKWWYRFWFGLPARPEDIKEIKEVLPELWNSNWQPDARRLRRLLPIPDFWFWPESLAPLFQQLREWVSSATEADEPLRHKSSFGQDSSEESCPLPDCPLGKYSEPAQEIEPPSEDLETIHSVFDLMCAGGGPDRQILKGEFLDLVRKVHRGTKSIKEVILTDPYIYLDVAEDGTRGGFNNLLEYLRTLGLVTESEFVIKLNPSPKKYNERAKQLFERIVKENFPNVKFETYSPKYVFHDRFYLVRDGNSQIKGVFGPSLNGLGSNAIALMGSLEQPRALARLSKWLG